MMMSPSGREGDTKDALESPDPRVAGEAAFAFAALHLHRAEPEAARSLLSQVERQPNTAFAAAAALRLARLHEAAGQAEAAALAYSRAAQKADPEFSADVLLDLAARWAARGDRERARLAYLGVKDRAPDAADRSLAALRLADLAREVGDVGAAIPLWRLALARANVRHRPHIALSLAEGLLEWEKSCDEDEVIDLLDSVIDSDHADLAPRAALEVAKLKRRRGELLEAYRYCQWVVESEHPLYAPGAELLEKDLLDGEVDSLFKQSEPSAPLAHPSDSSGSNRNVGNLPECIVSFQTPLILPRLDLPDATVAQIITAAKRWRSQIDGLRGGSALRWTVSYLSSDVDSKDASHGECLACAKRALAETRTEALDPEDPHFPPDFELNHAVSTPPDRLWVSTPITQVCLSPCRSAFETHPHGSGLLGLLGFVSVDETDIDPLTEMRVETEHHLFDATQPHLHLSPTGPRTFGGGLLGAELEWAGVGLCTLSADPQGTRSVSRLGLFA
jgi:tetratricopeptide (TPR) repeat protein